MLPAGEELRPDCSAVELAPDRLPVAGFATEWCVTPLAAVFDRVVLLAEDVFAEKCRCAKAEFAAEVPPIAE